MKPFIQENDQSANHLDRNHDQGQQLTKANQNAIAGLNKEMGIDIDEI
ncbi:MAG: hypothetical protein ACFB12_03335 [Leptolyngbyaceae cyanobacterium]